MPVSRRRHWIVLRAAVELLDTTLPLPPGQPLLHPAELERARQRLLLLMRLQVARGR